MAGEEVQKIDLAYLFGDTRRQARYLCTEVPPGLLLRTDGRARRKGFPKVRRVFEWSGSETGDSSQVESDLLGALIEDGSLQEELLEGMYGRVWIYIEDNQVAIEFDQTQSPGIWEIATFLPMANSIARHIRQVTR